MRILITGGAGFIGSHLVCEALARGHDVRVIDNLSTGRRDNLSGIEQDIEFFESDIRDYGLLQRLMRGVEVVFHLAALPSVPLSIEDPLTTTIVNVIGTTAVLKAAVDAGVRRVIYAASSSAYGDAPEPKKEETILPRPLSPYAVSKLAGEYMLQAFANCYGLETVGLRYFNVFGERQDPSSQYSGVIARFIAMMLRSERPTIHGDGTISRDFTYVQDVVDANFLAMYAPKDRVNGRVINVATGRSITLNQLVMELNRVLGTNLDPIYGPERPGDIHHSCADIRLARELIGYTPSVPFAVGLRKTVEWYRSQQL